MAVLVEQRFIQAIEFAEFADMAVPGDGRADLTSRGECDLPTFLSG